MMILCAEQGYEALAFLAGNAQTGPKHGLDGGMALVTAKWYNKS